MLESPTYHLEAVVRSKSENREDFKGPLDKILELLSKNKMEIKDIQITLILNQYLQWMEEQKALNLEVASEFVIMASHLVNIKTRMLLSVQTAEVTSEMEELIASLEAHRNNETYSSIKQITPQLMLQYHHGQNYLTKPPEILEKEENIVYSHKATDLWKAMNAVLSRMDGKKPVEIGAFHGIVGREPYPVQQKVMEIMGLLHRDKVCPLDTVLFQCQSRSEVVATFIALLDLCKSNRLSISEDSEEEELKLRYIDPEKSREDEESEDSEEENHGI